MARSPLERLLASCYPASSVIFEFLTAQDLVALKIASSTIKAVVDGSPVVTINFLPEYADDIWAKYFITFGYKITEQLFAKVLGNQPLPSVLRAYKRSGMAAESWILKLLLTDDAWMTSRLVTSPTCQLQGLRRLYLEGLTRPCFNAEQIIPLLDRLELLSLVGSTFSSLELRGALFKGKRRYKNIIPLRKLQIWQTSEILDLTRRAQDVEDFPRLYVSEFVSVGEWVLNIRALADICLLDTTFCKHHHGKVWAPAHIQNLTCMKYLVLKSSTDCPKCLLKRTCEICLGYYCTDCNPWDMNPFRACQIFDPSRIVDDDETEEHQVSSMECSARRESQLFAHMSVHRYHISCEKRSPGKRQCKFCRSDLCRWQKQDRSCVKCSEVMCDDCFDDYEYMRRCRVCDSSFCVEEQSPEALPYGPCIDDVLVCREHGCKFGVCGGCIALKDTEKAQAVFDFARRCCPICEDTYNLSDGGD